VFAEMAGDGGPETASWFEEHRGALTEGRWSELFLPRRAFGRYLAERVPQRLDQLRADGLLEVELIRDEAIGLSRKGPLLHVVSRSGTVRRTRRVVLSLGSGQMRRFWPQSAEADSAGSACLITDIYDPDLAHNLDRVAAHARNADEPTDLVIVGANASALELVLQLCDRKDLLGGLGRITIVTRSGELPQCPREAGATSTDARKPKRSAPRARHLRRLVGVTGITAQGLADAAFADIERARREGLGAVDVLARLGSEFGAMLDALDAADKLAFASQHGPAISRRQRRAGPHYALLLERLTAEGRLHVVRGEFLGLVDDEDAAAQVGVRYLYRDPDTGDTVTDGPVSVVVNCAGFTAVDAAEAMPLLQQLVGSGLCQPTAGGSGIQVNDQLEAAEGVHVIGPLLAGNVIAGRPVWHLEHCGRIDYYADHLAEVLADLPWSGAGPTTDEARADPPEMAIGALALQ
jgi:uncharacterized NAD(P)/FAD-binding protein YdhS